MKVPTRLESQLKYAINREADNRDYIYIVANITSLNNKVVTAHKIGYTQNIKQRFNNSTDNPNRLVIVFLARVENPEYLEEDLHDLFYEKNFERLRHNQVGAKKRGGEWYLLNDADLLLARNEIMAHSNVVLVKDILNKY